MRKSKRKHKDSQCLNEKQDMAAAYGHLGDDAGML